MQNRVIRTLLLAMAGLTIMLTISATSFAEVGVAITFGPPAIPVYDQPICPGDGYLWTPGYWAWDYDYDDYYWVPGTWVLAPEVGFLWTPGWWGWGDGAFVWNEGFWGPQIGFYGGINYGFGYFGVGFQGGRWDGGHFFYNRAVMNVNVTEIHNVYSTNIVVNNNTRISYNGGNGGVDRRPTSEEEGAARERHVGPVAAQTQHMQAARSDPQQRASVNMGRPAVAATARPGDFKGAGVVQAREAGGRYTPAPNRGSQARPEGNAARPSATHVSELPPAERPAPPNTGDAKQDQKLQKQQEKLYNQQQKERQKVAQQQQKEDQKLASQKASDAQRQQQEQRHSQQTQQLQQKHTQQNTELQQRVQAARPAGRPPK
jgi:hypothetical protein